PVHVYHRDLLSSARKGQRGYSAAAVAVWFHTRFRERQRLIELERIRSIDLRYVVTAPNEFLDGYQCCVRLPLRERHAVPLLAHPWRMVACLVHLARHRGQGSSSS